MSRFRYDFANLKGDFFGGVSAGIVALPLAMAFGVQSGLGAISGMYGAIAVGIFAAIFGGTRTQVSGPTGPMTVISSLVILDAINGAGSLEKGYGTILAVFSLAGLLLVLFGILRLGTYVKYIPYPVVSGFMTGIGVIIIVLQIFPFMGQESPKTIVNVFMNLPSGMSRISWDAVMVACATIAIIYVFPKITKSVPSILVALISVTLATTWLNIDVPLIGDIPKGFPQFKLGLMSMSSVPLTMIVELALTLALIGAIDSLLTSIIADNMTKTRHDSNRELIGQGIGNMAAACIGGLPGAGATMRTLVNINSGGRTRLSGVIHGLFLLLVLMGAGMYAAMIPLPILAGILITVGIGIIDYKGIRHLAHVPKADASVLVIVLFLTVFVDLIQAVAYGMILASVLFMKQMSDQVEEGAQILPIRSFKDEVAWEDEKIPPGISDKIYVKHFNGPIFFGFAPAFQVMAERLFESRVVVFRMERVPYIDQTGLYAMEEVILKLEKCKVAVVMTGLQAQPARLLRVVNIIPGLIPDRYIFQTFSEFVNWLEQELDGKDIDAMSKYFDEMVDKNPGLDPMFRL